MIAADEDALVCDLAETYHIYDYRQLPTHQVAVFAVGLRDDARIKIKLSGQKESLDRLLLASMVDRLSLLVWAKTKDGQKGQNQPVSLVSRLVDEEQKESDLIAFESGEDFLRAREQLLKEIGGEGNGD